MRGEKLEQMYRPSDAEPATGGAVRSSTRDVVYLSPQLFEVYGRTTADSAGRDQSLAWHFGKIPVEVVAPQGGSHRWDITYNGTYSGAMTTVLPSGNATSLVNVFNSNKVYRIEGRAGSTAASHTWLTVFDASASSGAVSTATRLTAMSRPTPCRACCWPEVAATMWCCLGPVQRVVRSVVWSALSSGQQSAALC